MFGIGGFELFIILLFGFLIFGPDKLPEMAKTLGAALRKFNQAKTEMESVIKGEVLDVDGKQGKKPSPASGAKVAPTATQESFAERKARYDRERAERQEREAIETNRRAMKDKAAKDAQAAQAQATASAEESSAAVKPGAVTKPKPGLAAQPRVASKPAPKVSSQGNVASAKPAIPTTTLTPDELFGNKPMRKPVSKGASKGAAHASSSAAVSSDSAAVLTTERGE